MPIRAIKERLSFSLNREAQNSVLRCAIYAAKRWTMQRKAEVVTAVRRDIVVLSARARALDKVPSCRQVERADSGSWC
jgi:hypothetical protein